MSRTKELAGQLGISPKQLSKLERKHGEKLESVLTVWWNESREKVRILGRQGEYTTSVVAALWTSDPEESRRQPEPEAVSDEYQRLITMEAHGRWADYERTEKAEEVTKRELRNVTQALREVALLAARNGIDPAPLFEAIKAQVAAQRDEVERKAA